MRSFVEWRMCARMQSRFSHDRLCVTVTLCTIAHQAPSPMGFFRQEYLSGLPCSPPGDLPNPGIKPVSLTSPASAERFFITSSPWEALQSNSRQQRTWGLSKQIQGTPTGRNQEEEKSLRKRMEGSSQWGRKKCRLYVPESRERIFSRATSNTAEKLMNTMFQKLSLNFMTRVYM